MSAILKITVALAAAAAAVSAAESDHKKPKTAPTGAKVLTVAVIGDYGWTGWTPNPLHFCNDVMPRLIADNITIPKEVTNDCDPGDRTYITNATALQETTATYVGQVCAIKNCTAYLSTGDNFYDSGVDFTTGGILRFEEAWLQMYNDGIFKDAPWYQCLGNHDIVKGQSGVDFETKIAPYYDPRWYFGANGADNLPYYTYDIAGEDWTATFVVVDSDCFMNAYQEPTSVYYNDYVVNCYKDMQVQVDFLKNSFAASKADWKFIQLHHPFLSATANNTDLWPLIQVVQEYNGIVLNGHDHCLGHYYGNNTNYVLSGAAGYPQAGDCNNGVYIGPYIKYLGGNAQAAANGFVTMDISKESVNVEYYARDMKFEGGDLFPVPHDLTPSYSFTITEKST